MLTGRTVRNLKAPTTFATHERPARTDTILEAYLHLLAALPAASQQALIAPA